MLRRSWSVSISQMPHFRVDLAAHELRCLPRKLPRMRVSRHIAQRFAAAMQNEPPDARQRLHFLYVMCRLTMDWAQWGQGHDCPPQASQVRMSLGMRWPSTTSLMAKPGFQTQCRIIQFLGV